MLCRMEAWNIDFWSKKVSKSGLEGSFLVSWRVWGPLWRHLGGIVCSWVVLGGSLARFWEPLGPLWGAFGDLWVPFWWSVASLWASFLYFCGNVKIYENRKENMFLQVLGRSWEAVWRHFALIWWLEGCFCLKLVFSRSGYGKRMHLASLLGDPGSATPPRRAHGERRGNRLWGPQRRDLEVWSRSG